MNLAQMRARVAALQTQIAAAAAERNAPVDAAVAEQRGMTADEQTAHAAAEARHADLVAQLAPVEARVAELEDAERREAAAAGIRVELGNVGEQRAEGGAQVTDPPVYVRSGATGASYFRDLADVQLQRSGAPAATERLRRYTASTETEQRALGNTNTVGGSGGEFAPPVWLIEDFINIARPGRVTADLFRHSDVPLGVSSINLPKLLTGTAIGPQTTQNTVLPTADVTTGSVGTGFATVGGTEVVSQQLLDQTAINFDDVITADLAAAYATQIGAQVIYGAGTGLNNNAVVNGLANAIVPAGSQITYTSASPTAAGFFSKCAGALSTFVTSRFAQPTHWLMHPRRYYWLLAQVDSQGRPLVVPVAQGPLNTIASNTPEVAVQGNTGMTFLGLPVFVDPQLPVNLGANTNQDEVFLIKADDLWLFESPFRAEVFREPFAQTVGVLFRLYSYVGTILNRRPTSIVTINGTGLAAPSF